MEAYRRRPCCSGNYERNKSRLFTSLSAFQIQKDHKERILPFCPHLPPSLWLLLLLLHWCCCMLKYTAAVAAAGFQVRTNQRRVGFSSSSRSSYLMLYVRLLYVFYNKSFFYLGYRVYSNLAAVQQYTAVSYIMVYTAQYTAVEQEYLPVHIICMYTHT